MKTLIIDFTKPLCDYLITEDTEILGLFLGQSSQKVSGKFLVVHEKPGLKSRILIKAVLEDKAQFEIEPIIVIKEGAKLTDSYLKVAVLVTSDGAKAKVIPSLEITEKEVKAGHGASIGKLDSEQMFYLQSRGLTKDSARQLLIKGFVNDIIDKISLNTGSLE